MDPITNASKVFADQALRYWKSGRGQVLRMVADPSERTNIIKLLRAQEWDLQNRWPLFMYDLPFDASDAYFRKLCDKVAEDYQALLDGLAKDKLTVPRFDGGSLKSIERLDAPMRAGWFISRTAELLRAHLGGAMLALLPRQISNRTQWRQGLQRMLTGIVSQHVRVALYDHPGGPLDDLWQGQGEASFLVDQAALLDYFKQAGLQGHMGPPSHAAAAPASAPASASASASAPAQQRQESENQTSRKLMDPDTGKRLRQLLMDSAQQNNKGEHAIALAGYREAVALCVQGGFVSEEAMVLMAMAGGYLATGETEQAIQAYRDAADLAKELTLWPLACHAWLGVGGALLRSLRYKPAVSAYENAANAAQQGGVYVLEIEALRMAGTCHMMLGGQQEAAGCWQRAVDRGSELPLAERQASTMPQAGTALAEVLERHNLREQAAHVRALVSKGQTS